MGLVFLLSWFAQSLAGWAAFNETRLQRLQDPLSWGGYLVNADFWARSLQNWQSEFLAVGSMAVFSIYLRQRGSPESKPVGAAHASTGVEGLSGRGTGQPPRLLPRGVGNTARWLLRANVAPWSPSACQPV